MTLDEARSINRTAMRKAILDQASALLTEEGPDALSMRKLSKRVGASTIVLYTYFRDKQEILDELYREGFDRLRARLAAVPPGEDPMDYVMALGRAYRASAVANATYYQIMFSRCVPGFTPSPQSRDAARQALAILAGGVKRCIAAGQAAAEDPMALTEVLWGALHGLISLDLFGYLSGTAAANGEARLEQAMAIIRAGAMTPAKPNRTV